jgi:hypothetical protein
MNPIDRALDLVGSFCPDDAIVSQVVPAIEGWRRDRYGEGWRAYRHDIDDYMQRVILQAPHGTLRLHRILRSDASDPHDHPWDFASRILRGVYVEQRPGQAREERFGPGSINAKRAEDLHRLVVVEGPVWTFVETGPVKREWGFALEGGRWINWRRYTRQMERR